MDSADAGKILVVDDIPESVRLLDAVLPARVRMLTATSGQEARDLAAIARPDLIVLGEIPAAKADGKWHRKETASGEILSGDAEGKGEKVG